MPDLAELGVVVKSDQAAKAAGDLNRLTKAGVGAEASVGGLSRTATRAQASITSLISPLKIITGLIAGIGLSVGLGSALSEFSDFEKSLIGVGKTTNIAGQQLKNLGKDIELLTRVLPNTAVELNGIAQAAGQLGVTGTENILKFTQTVARLGSATNLSGEEAASTLARILTITGEAIGTVDVFGSVIVRLGNNFAATEAEIASAANRVAQATALFRTSSADVAAIGTAMTAVGVQAEAGGTVVGRAFSVINKAVNVGGEELKVLTGLMGQTGEALRAAFNENSTAVFEQFIKSLGDIDRTKVTSVLDELGLSGVRVEAVLGTLATRSDVLSDALRQAEDELENTTALMTESETATKAYAAQMVIAGNNASELKNAIGAVIAPTALAIAQQAAKIMLDLAENVDILVDSFKLLGIIITGQVIGSLTAKITKTLADVAAMKAAAVASAAQAKATLAGAQAEIRMAAAMAPGIARRTALAAAATRAAAANTALAASNAAVGVSAGLAARSMELMRGVLGFLGGPIVGTITLLAGAFFLFKTNTGLAADAQAELDRVMRDSNSTMDEATASARELALERAHQAITAKQAAQAELELQAARIQSQIQAQAGANGRTPASMFQIGALKDIGEAHEKLTSEIKQLITQASEGVNVIKNVNNQFEDGADKASQYGGAISDTEKDAKDFITTMRRQVSQMEKMVIAAGKGEDAVKELNTQIEIEEELARLNIKADSDLGKVIASLIQSYNEYKEAVEDTNEVNKAAERQAEETAKALKKAQEESAKELQKPFDRAAEGIQDAFTDMFVDLFDNADDAFSNMADSMKDTFKRMVAELATLAIRPIIVNLVGSIGNTLGLSQQAISGVTGQFGGAAAGAAGGVGGYAGLGLGASIASLGAGISTGFGLATANIGAAGYFGSFGANASLASSSLANGSFGTAIGAAAPYLPIIGGALYGYSQNGIQGAVTGGLGAAGGAALGSAILPGIGTIIGGVLGGLLGGSIGPKPSNKGGTATADLETGDISISGQTGKKFSQKNRDAAEELAKGALEIVDLLKQTLDGKFDQELKVTVGDRDGIVVQLGNQAAQNFGYNTEALIAGLIETVVGSMTGIAPEVKDAVENIDFSNLQQAAQDLQFIADFTSGDMFGVAEQIPAAQQALDQLNATFDAVADTADRLGLSVSKVELERLNAQAQLLEDFNTSIQDQIENIINPIGLILEEQERVAQERLENAEILGADLVQVERLNALERQRVLEQTFSGINDYLETLNLGPTSTLTPIERLTEAQNKFDETLLAAQGGDLNSIQSLPEFAQQLLTEASSFFAGTEPFQEIFDMVTNSLQGIVASDGGSTLQNAVDNVGAQSVDNTSDIVNAIEVLTAATTSNRTQIAELLDVVQQLIASQEAA